jgi:phosphomannomutase
MNQPYSLSGETEAKVLAWIEQDVSEKDKTQLKTLLADAKTGSADSVSALESMFEADLEFGTAGLRGKMEAGSNRMNRSVVIRAAAGLANYLNSKIDKPKVVIGYDARHNSYQFALDSAGVFAEQGLDVHLMAEKLPTPLLAYAIGHLKADAGVMVTASHNPAQDNGYKVYLGGRLDIGAQIIPPADAEISAEIKKITSANAVRRAESGWSLIPKSILKCYYKDAYRILYDGKDRANITIATTAMHGVGGPVQIEILNEFGFKDVHFVPEQQEPDPDFPTVAFPNPEEKGAMDLVLSLADKVNANLIIANDPDADRMASGIYDSRLGKHRALTGDETGMILGHHFVKKAKREGLKSAVVASSIVSSRSLAKIAAENGVTYKPTLTGFKWISREQGEIFGYEEALGLLVVPEIVKDKDGPTAGALMAQIASEQALHGETLEDLLDDLARQYGLFTQRQVSIRFSSKEKIVGLVEQLRKNPPKEIGKSPVTFTKDLSKDNGGLPTTNAVVFVTDDSTRVIVRPSGTEPKVKFYIETLTDVKEDATFDEITALRNAAAEKIDEICDEFRSLG